MVDNYSKFIKVYAPKDRTAITASCFVYDNCLVYGIPQKITRIKILLSKKLCLLN